MASNQLKPAIPPTNVLTLAHSFHITELMLTATRLQVFDKLEAAGEPVKVTKLAQDLNVHADALERVMNGCTSMGLLIRSEVNSEVYFTNNEEATLYLTKKSPFNVLGVFPPIDIFGRPAFKLEESLKPDKQKSHKTLPTGNPSPEDLFRTVYGTKDRFKVFVNGMEAVAKTCLHLISELDLGMFTHAVDLGGCFGIHARTLKSLHPNMRVTLADLTPVIEEAKEEEDNKNTDIEFAECDFFNAATLPQADLYLLGHILHDWTDERCGLILQNVYQALHPGGCILVLEKIMNKNKAGDLFLNGSDLMMMVINDGRERTEQEYRDLLEDKGFQSITVKKDGSSPYYDAITAFKK